jgi:hypothetical protein
VASGLLILKTPGENVTGPGKATGFQMTDSVILETGESRRWAHKILGNVGKGREYGLEKEQKPVLAGPYL